MVKERKFTLVETRGAVAKITINRPEKRNALSRDAIREILAVFEELRNDDSIAVVLTTGAGDVAYCAGRDLSEFPTEGGQNRGTDRRKEPRAYHVAEVIRTFPKVTIAVGGGFRPDELLAEVRTTWAYRDLTDADRCPTPGHRGLHGATTGSSTRT